MSWLGKFLGGAFGFLMGGPLGAILGAALGHHLDVGMEGLERFEAGHGHFDPGDQHRVQTAFFTATFSVMGHIAKADGRVSESEIELARRVMDEMRLTAPMREAAVNLFQQGKSPGFPLDAALDQFRKECHRRTNLILMFLEIQIQAAYADGALHAAEDRLLMHICGRLGVSRFDYERLKIQLQAQQRFYQHERQRPAQRGASTSDAYAVLDVSPSAGDDEVKKAYRRLISQHHPDKLVAKGLPEEMMTLAKEKTQQIRKAYETIMESRKN
ncbi:MAG: co-chaperone DjlA [Gammaproteobacteria bacterium]